jgi:hypothetical protein
VQPELFKPALIIKNGPSYSVVDGFLLSTFAFKPLARILRLLESLVRGLLKVVSESPMIRDRHRRREVWDEGSYRRAMGNRQKR